MGYVVEELIRVYVRLDNHLDERTTADKVAAARLREEIIALIQSDPAYERICPEYRR